jgi:hypothetical protein
MRDYEVRTRDKSTGDFKGWRKVGDLPTHALIWLLDCDWSIAAPETEDRNGATRDDIRSRISIELTARQIEGRAA